MLPPLRDDPRFTAALAYFAGGDWLEASDLFEELYFEAVRDELPIVRLMLQCSTGLHHISRGQRGAAAERLEEGLRVLPAVEDSHGIDLEQVRRVVEDALSSLRGTQPR